jgi:hypothetical protein
MNIKVLDSPTVTANVARGLGEWLQSRVTSPGIRLSQNAIQCAQGATEVSAPNTFLEDRVRAALENSPSCVAVYKVFEKPETEASGEVVDLAKSIGRGIWIDQLAALIAKTHGRL